MFFNLCETRNLVLRLTPLLGLIHIGVEATCPDPNPCIYPSSINGDEVCDDITNTCACGWDGGDCCSSSSDRSYCTQCECLYTTTPTPTTTPNRTTPGECIDGMSLLSPDNIAVWADVWGYSCEDYFFNDWCVEYGPRNADSAGRTAAEACCACGGGNVNNEWTFTTETPCTGSMPNWTVRVPLDLYSLNPSAATTQSTDANANASGVAPTHANLTCLDFKSGLCYWRAMSSIEGTGGLAASDACCECGATYVAPTPPPDPVCFGGLGTWALYEFLDENGLPILSVSDCDAVMGAATTVIALLLIVGIACVGTKVITDYKKRAKAALRHAPKSQLEIEIERRKREDAERKAKEDEEAAQRKALEDEFNAESEARRLAAQEAAKNKFANRQAKLNEAERKRRLILKNEEIKRREAEFERLNPGWAEALAEAERKEKEGLAANMKGTDVMRFEAAQAAQQAQAHGGASPV